MGKENSFKLSAPLDRRQQQCTRIRDKYPDRVPIICEVAKNCDLLLDKSKYLVPVDLTIGQFQYTIRKRISNLDSSLALYMFVNNSLVSMADIMQNVYEEKKDPDGFLYIVLNIESTFGSLFPF